MRLFPRAGVAPARLATIAILLLVAGCAPQAEVAEEAHHLPAHHPGTFRRAVEELARRGEACGARAATAPDGALPETELGALADIVRWLPELAADTALPRREWERVRDESRRLGAALTGAASGREGAGPAAVAAAVAGAVGTLRDVQATLATDAFQGEEP